MAFALRLISPVISIEVFLVRCMHALLGFDAMTGSAPIASTASMLLLESQPASAKAWKQR